uniref:Uncharacterized protein n=1 Tax=Arundo donax TaxID=35708 RepID=A0A0A9BVM5_ARUDO
MITSPDRWQTYGCLRKQCKHHNQCLNFCRKRFFFSITIHTIRDSTYLNNGTIR